MCLASRERALTNQLLFASVLLLCPTTSLLIFLLHGLLVLYSEGFINHNDKGLNEGGRTTLYNDYKKDLKSKQAFRILNFFLSSKIEELHRNRSFARGDSRVALPADEGTQFTGDDEMIAPLKLQRKIDLENGQWLIEHRKRPSSDIYLTDEPVEIHVFRDPNVQYTDRNGDSKEFARWGYFISQSPTFQTRQKKRLPRRLSSR